MAATGVRSLPLCLRPGSRQHNVHDEDLVLGADGVAAAVLVDDLFDAQDAVAVALLVFL